MPEKPMSWVSRRRSGRLPLVLLAQGDLLAAAQRALDDPADRQPTEVVGRVEVGDEGLQGRVGIARRAADGGDDGLEQRR